MSVVLLVVLLAGPKPAPVTIYVGPQIRDGFVQTDQGVRDSARDLREALGKDKALRVVESEDGATLKLYVSGRRKSPGQSITVGSVANGTGSVVGVPTEIFILEVTMRVGTYEQSFTTEKNQATDWHVTWKKCASEIAKDVSAWVGANRERIASKQ
jgi:hypothetical protein